MTGPVFYLGTHQPEWLWSPDVAVPLFVSARRLGQMPYTRMRPALSRWALDSGGFTELSMHGTWTTSPDVYCGMVAELDRIIGGLDWAAPQDWMCEPAIIHGGQLPNGQTTPGTGLTVDVHQARTVENFLTLRDLWPQYSDSECPFMPVLQGWTGPHYERCAARYAAAGVRLDEYPVVGLGSVCRRQDTGEIGAIAATFTPWLALHGFGVKLAGLSAYGHMLTSADSLAWSFTARRDAALPGCRHQSCANCPRYALAWRDRVLAAITQAAGSQQLDLFRTPPPDCHRCGGECREPGA